jgi:malonyl CoA-acyl carrier protein transacylase
MGRGGLLRVAATTAVVAGTATAVSGGIRGRQDAKSQQAAEAQAYEQEQQQAQMDAAAQQAVAAQQAAAPPAPAAAAPSAGDDLMAQIQNLATMHSQGILSDDEFAAAKAKLLT